MISDFNYYIVELLYHIVSSEFWLSYKGDYIPITNNLQPVKFDSKELAIASIESSENYKDQGYRIVKVHTTCEMVK